MLSRTSYTQDYIDACRARVAAQVASYTAVERSAAKAKSAPLGKALDALEPVFFNNMVLSLDSFFTHRARALEGKDGNPLNEVRVLCTSMLENDGRLAPEKSIKLTASTSILGYEVGDEIHLRRTDFERLADAYFTEIEKKYT